MLPRSFLRRLPLPRPSLPRAPLGPFGLDHLLLSPPPQPTTSRSPPPRPPSPRSSLPRASTLAPHGFGHLTLPPKCTALPTPLPTSARHQRLPPATRPRRRLPSSTGTPDPSRSRLPDAANTASPTVPRDCPDLPPATRTQLGTSTDHHHRRPSSPPRPGPSAPTISPKPISTRRPSSRQQSPDLTRCPTATPLLQQPSPHRSRPYDDKTPTPRPDHRPHPARPSKTSRAP